MPREPLNKEQEDALEKRILELENFNKKLIEALQAAEKKINQYLLPSGEYFGITIK